MANFWEFENGELKQVIDDSMIFDLKFLLTNKSTFSGKILATN